MFDVNGIGVNYIAPPGAKDVPPKYHKTLLKALKIIKDRIVGKAKCDTEFAKLPNGRTFTNLFNHSGIIVYYDPNIMRLVFFFNRYDLLVKNHLTLRRKICF